MSINYMKLAGEMQDPSRFPDDALHRMVKSPNPAVPMEQSLAMGEWMRRQKLRQGSTSAGQSDNRSVKDLVLDHAQQKAAMEVNPAVQNYPQPQMDTRGTVPQAGPNFAGGGLVAFGPGGFVPSGDKYKVRPPEDSDVEGFLPWLGKSLVQAPGHEWGLPSALMDRVKGMYAAGPNASADPMWAGQGLPRSGAEVAMTTGNTSVPPPPYIPQATGIAAPVAEARAPAPTRAAGIGASAAVSPYAKDLKDALADKPMVESAEGIYDKQSKLWEKVLGKEGYSKEKDDIENDREGAKKDKEFNKAYAMLSAAGSMMSQENPLERGAGLGGFLQGIGRAAKTATPILMEGDKEYKAAIKDANRLALEIKKGERAEAAGRAGEALKSHDRQAELLEKFKERSMGVLEKLENERIQSSDRRYHTDRMAAASGKNNQLEILKAIKDDPKLAAAYDRMHGNDFRAPAAMAKAMTDWEAKNPMLVMGKSVAERRTMFLRAHPEYGGEKASGIATIDGSSLFPPKQQ